MAKLLTGTRIYGTGTVDTQLFVSGTNSATSTTTGALQVVGGVGIGGNLYVGGTIFGGIITGTASTATNADNIKTVLQTSSASHYLAFVDANNSTAAYEALYTTSSFIINPQSGAIGIGTSTITSSVEAFSSNPGFKANDGTSNVHVQVNGSNPRVVFIDGRSGGRRFDIGSSYSTATFSIIDRTAGIERLLIDANGNIGIGTTTPASKFVVYGGTVNSTTYTSSEARIADGTLHLMKTSAGGVFEALRAINNDTTVGTTVRLLAAATSDPFNNANGGKVFIDAVRTASNMDLIFSLNDASGAAAVERLRILGSGAIAFNGSTSYGVSGQILQSNGNAAPTWISTGSLAAANATTATHLSGGVAGQIPYQTAPGVTSFLSTGTAGNVLVSNGSSAPTYNNTLTLTGTTAATSTTTGALQVVGGFGLGGDLFIRGDIATNDTTFNLINSTATTVNFAGAATTLTMGASGSGTTNVRNNLTVSGNLTVQGTTTIVDSTVTNIADPILTLGGGTGNSAPTADDNKDRGVAFKWVNNGGTTSTGFFGYDDSTGYFTYVQTATITNEVVSGTKGAMDVNLAGGTAMSIVYQSSQDNTAFLAATTSGYLLQTNGTGSAPSWVNASGVSAGSATYADNVRTIAQAASASYYPTFVDSNNASNAYELVYTTSSFSINPATGAVSTGELSATKTGASLNFAFNALNVDFTDSGGSATGIAFGVGGSNNRKGALVYERKGAYGVGDFHFLQNTDNAGTAIPTLAQAVLTIKNNGNVGIGTTSPAAKLDVQAGDGGDSRSIQSVLPGSGSYNPAVSNTPGKVVSGIKFNWYSDNWQIGAARSGATSVDGFVISRNNTSTVVITANGALAFGLPTSYGSSGQILQSNGDATPTWVSPGGITGVNADQVRTIAQTANATYYPAFVDSNNAANAYELVYTTSSFSINPQSGNVGIGTTSPSVKLHVVGNTYLNGVTTSTGALTVNSTLNAVGKMSVYVPSTNTITFADNTSTAGLVIVGTGDRVRLQLGIGSNAIGPYGAWIQASYDNTGGAVGSEPLLLNPAGGYVGIGTASPLSQLDVTGSTNVFQRIRTTAAGSTNIALRIQDGTTGSTDGDGIYLGRTGADATNYLWTYENEPWVFATNNTERIRITATGGVAFGGSTNYGTSGQLLKSNGDAAPTWINQSSITVGTSTQVNTVLQTANATYFPTFVDANNAAAAAESLYTTSSFTINPSTGFVGVGYASAQTNGLLQVAGGIGIAANSTVRQATNGDGGTLKFYGTQFVAGQNNSGSYGYTGGAGIASVSPSASYVTLDVGGQGTGNSHRLKVVNDGTGITGYLYYGQEGGSTATLYANVATGNVGIGTTSPPSKLSVEGAGTANESVARFNNQGDYASRIWLRQSSRSAYFSVAGSTGDTLATGSLPYGLLIGLTGSPSPIQFYNGSTGVVKMTIDTTGNVGIGTTSTTNKFEVAGTAGQLFSVSDSFTGTIFSVNDISGIPSIEVLDTGLVKMAQYNGAVAIGTGTITSSTAELSVYGMLYTLGSQGEIRASSEITAYFSSDRRLKENIKLIENPITIIDQIRGVTFDWTDEHMARRGGEDGYFVRKHDIGVIAQEVQAVLPELVGTREDGYLAVKYEKMVPLLIEAIKSQQKTIDSLVKDLANVKEFINQLKNNK